MPGNVIAEGTNPDSSPLREWITHYRYDDTTFRQTRVYTPASMQSYNPSAPDDDDIFDEASSGLVHVFEYNAARRQTKSYVYDGDPDASGATPVIISEVTYPNADSGTSREHLPTKIERFRSDDLPPFNADEIETVEYEYDFFGSSASDDRLRVVTTKVESEGTDENGPGVLYESKAYIDGRGDTVASIDATDCITKRTYDSSDGHGELTEITRNEDKADVSWPSGAAQPSSDRNGDGGSLTTKYQRDIMGRVQSAEGPGGVFDYTRRELREFSDRPNLLYYAHVSLPHRIASGERTAGSLFNGPASISWMNADNDGLGSSDYVISSHTIDTTPDDFGIVATDYVLGSELTRSITRHDASGLVTESLIWHDLIQAPGGGYSSTRYEYDELGRQSVSIDALGTVYRTSFDALDRAIKSEIGIVDAFGDVNPTSMIATNEQFYDTTSASHAGVGNSTIGVTKAYDGASDRITKYSYDFRDRNTIIENALAPHQAVEYDNLDRIVSSAVFSSVPTDIETPLADRGALTTAYFSQRGLVYRRDVSMDPNTSTTDSLQTHTWFDANGRVAASWAPNGPGRKTTFDGLGRPLSVYVTDMGGGMADFTDVYDATNWIADVAGDHVLEQIDYGYIDSSGLLERVTTKKRTHSATSPGAFFNDVDPMTGDSGDDDTTDYVTSHVATIYDGANRPMYQINFGTMQDDTENGDIGIYAAGGDDTDLTGAISNLQNPSSSNDLTSGPDITIGNSGWQGEKRVTMTSYGARGIVSGIRDPEGRWTVYQFDDRNRIVAQFENIDDASIAWDATVSPNRWIASNVDESDWYDIDSTSYMSTDAVLSGTDRVTSFVYDGLSNVTMQIAHQADTTGGGSTAGDRDQVTTYSYGIRSGSASSYEPYSNINSNSHLRQVLYPEEIIDNGSSTATAPTNSYAYNHQGEIIQMDDENGTIHEYERDALGRVTVDHASTIAAHVDKTTVAIKTTFDSLGRVADVESFSSYGTSNTVANETEFSYDDLWQITEVTQEHDGSVTGTSLSVEYAYTIEAADHDASSPQNLGNYSRLDYMTYPTGHPYEVSYGTSGQLDDVISRPVEYNAPLNPVASTLFDDVFAFEFIGTSTVSSVDYIIPDIQLDRSAQHNGRRHFGSYESDSNANNPGEYPGFDRYGRIARQMWVDGGFTHHATSTTVSNVPPIVELRYDYDDASNRTEMIDAREGSDSPISWLYKYDGLDRLVDATKVAGDPGGSPSVLPGSQLWKLDHLGNKQKVITKPSGGASSPGDGEVRTFDKLNTLREWDDVVAGSSNDFQAMTDVAGNVLSKELASASGIFHTYKHDAWDRLVEVNHDDNGTITPIGRYEYNGLNWRILRELEANATASGLDEQRICYFGANWQLLEEHVDIQSPFSGDTDYVEQYIWGPRYIDDIIAHRRDSDLDDLIDDTYYHCTDAQYSTIAILNDSAVVLERVSYSPYGVARHHWAGDIDGDGDQDQDDRNIVKPRDPTNLHGSVIDDGNYRANADLNRDGEIDNDDHTLAGNGGTFVINKAALAEGTLTDKTVGNLIGFDGYHYDEESSLYRVRFRSYEPERGRWIERDPLIANSVADISNSSGQLRGLLHSDGPSLYQFVRSNPVLYVDRTGLEAESAPDSPAVQSQIDPDDPRNQIENGCGIKIRRKPTTRDPVTGQKRKTHDWIEIHDPLNDVPNWRPGRGIPPNRVEGIGFFPSDRDDLFDSQGEFKSRYAEFQSNADCVCSNAQVGDDSKFLETPAGRYGKDWKEWTPLPKRGTRGYDYWNGMKVWRYDAPRLANGTLLAQATCDEIRNCVRYAIVNRRYDLRTYNCRHAVDDILGQCGLTRDPDEEYLPGKPRKREPLR